nr:unnamed protein product [Callosobruchus chinensis]
MEEAVLNEIERNPETSTRKIAHELNITHVAVSSLSAVAGEVAAVDVADGSHVAVDVAYCLLSFAVEQCASHLEVDCPPEQEYSFLRYK